VIRLTSRGRRTRGDNLRRGAGGPGADRGDPGATGLRPAVQRPGAVDRPPPLPDPNRETATRTDPPQHAGSRAIFCAPAAGSGAAARGEASPDQAVVSAMSGLAESCVDSSWAATSVRSSTLRLQGSRQK
jgi:hypothetical protein